MSSPVSGEVDASQSRGRKRSHAEAEKGVPTSKRSKLSSDATVHSLNSHRKQDDHHKRRNMTPEELAHEKKIKERSKKYQRGTGEKPRVRPLLCSFYITRLLKSPILTLLSALRRERQAFEDFDYETRCEVPSSR